MVENPQNPNQPPKPNVMAEILSGGIVGAAIGAVASIFNRKSPIGRQMRTGAAIGAGVGLLIHWLGIDKNPPKNLSQPASPTLPPALPEYPQGSALANVPQLLDMLVAREQMSAESQAHVLASIKTGDHGFAGELAVRKGLVAPIHVAQALADQSALKAEAAIVDINNISQFGTLPSYIPSNWGNNGVNPAPTPATRMDGMSAAANIAQNLVALANANPQLLPLVRDGVVAATYLTRGIAQGDSAVVPLAKMSESWRNSMNNALLLAAQTNPQLVVDANGQPIDITQFIAARNAEITTAVQQTLNQGPDRNQSQAR